MPSIDPTVVRTEKPQPLSVRFKREWQSAARFLYTQNPFYLLSVAFVLHSTKFWYRAGDGAYDPWPLMAIIGGYLVLVAITGFLLVRLWSAWDDVRSILLMLLLLFVELSLTFDTILIGQPNTGRMLLVTGLALSVGLSEFLLRGLKIRLPALYRVPYHCFLTLLFLYPLVIVAASKHGVSAGRWSIFAFWPASAILLTTLLPAICRGAGYVSNNGTPWRWPWYPWSLFVFLTVCVGLRGYSLGLSFDPVMSQNYETAMQLQSAFGTYFVVPLLLAIALLLLEAGLVTGNRRLLWMALALPIVCLGMSIPGPDSNAPRAEFLSQFMSQFGTPVRLTIWAAAVFYAYAAVRRVQIALAALLATLLIAALVGRATVSLATLGPLQDWPLWLIAVLQGIHGYNQRSSRRCLIAVLCGIAALHPHLPSAWSWLYREAALAHLAGLAVLALGALFHDPFARYLRKVGVALLITATLVAATLAPPSADIPEAGVPAYLCAVVAGTFAYAYLVRSPNYFFAGLLNGLIGAARVMWELSKQLELLLAWRGAGYFVAGLCWFGLAVLISAAKAGAFRRFAAWIPRRSA